MRIQVQRSQKQLNVQNIGRRRLIAILILCASVTAIMKVDSVLVLEY